MELFKYKCPMCGGELDVNEEITVGICQYCNSTIAIPKNLGERSQMYNRAIYLRQNNEFDRAIGVYEDMLKRDNTDVEAHFGLFLSKYGIEYVEDPRTRERKPTCHRLQTRSVYADSDYKAAIEYADPMSRDVYESEAARINAIVKRIQELAANEKPYDIFICYKETDIGDERTEDSRIAQELYQRLERKGYRVFFARKTLENQLGSEYEPVIFSAINTAKVMIVLGTKKEYFNAVWVRNEWSRYIELVAENPEKVLIPVYKNMSAYDLPDELAVFQSQDMGRLGFMEDLQDAIEKFIRRNKSSQEQITTIMGAQENDSVEVELDRAETFLKLGETEKAKVIYQRLPDQYPNDYRTWYAYARFLSNAFQDMNNYEEACRFMEHALKVAPDDEKNNIKAILNQYKKVKLTELKENIEIKVGELVSQNEKLKEQIKEIVQKVQEYESEKNRIQMEVQNGKDEMKQYKKKETDINMLKATKKKKLSIYFFIVAFGIGISCAVFGIVSVALEDADIFVSFGDADILLILLFIILIVPFLVVCIKTVLQCYKLNINNEECNKGKTAMEQKIRYCGEKIKNIAKECEKYRTQKKYYLERQREIEEEINKMQSKLQGIEHELLI